MDCGGACEERCRASWRHNLCVQERVRGVLREVQLRAVGHLRQLRHLLLLCP
ncbi:unnamed protein product, partial [Musa textilis]